MKDVRNFYRDLHARFWYADLFLIENKEKRKKYLNSILKFVKFYTLLNYRDNLIGITKNDSELIFLSH